MIQILLVDDDPIMRMRLKTLIPLQALDCEVCAEAANGLEAIACVERMHPQIVIADMNMPEMDGVALIDYLHTHLPEIVVIALSAYDDFTYVRGSLKYGAFDYLLKHQLTPQVFADVLTKALSNVEHSQTASASHDPLTVLLSGDESRIAAEAAWFKERYGLEQNQFFLARGLLEGDRTVKEDADAYVRALIAETLSMYDKPFFFVMRERCPLILFALDEDEEPLLEEVLSQVQQNSERFANESISFMVGLPYFDLAETAERLSALIREQDNARFAGKNNAIIRCSAQRNEERGAPLSLERERQLMDSLQGHREEEANACLLEIYEQMDRSHAGRSQAQLISIDLMNLLIRAAQTLGIELSEIFGGAEPYSVLQGAVDRDEIQRWLNEWFASFFRCQTEREQNAGGGELVAQAVQWIHEHYAQEISLSDAAVELSVSSAYLSRLFSRKMGTTVVKYINRLRMEKARELIVQGKLSLKEIADQVGIQNYNYFYLLYKKTYGVAPSGKTHSS